MNSDKIELKNMGPIGEVLAGDKRAASPYAQHVGDLTDSETGAPTYRLFVNHMKGTPIIVHLESGNWWTTTWRQLVTLAEREGILDTGPLSSPGTPGDGYLPPA